jgi:hypothetical protein
MKGNGKNVFEIEHHQAIDSVNRHSDDERPLLAFARKIPEDNEDSGNEAVDDQIERKPALTGLVRKCVHEFGNP